MKYRCFGAVLVVILLSDAGFAQTIRRVPDDFATIQAGINAAQAGDTVLVSPGTYIENINFLGKAITVVSEGGRDLTIIDGAANGPVVRFVTGEGRSSVLDGFTIRNGKALTSEEGGGIRIAVSSPTIRNNRITKNAACSGGAGIGIVGNSPLIQGNIITENASSQFCSGGFGGGGILIKYLGSSEILDNVISKNSVKSASAPGGGISVNSGAPLIRGNVIIGNSGINGGGINFEALDGAITQNVIAGNSGSRGGGIYWRVFTGGQASVTNNTIVDNSVTQVGSAILADGADGAMQVKNNLVIGKTGQTAFYCDSFNDSNPPILAFNNIFSSGASSYGGICADVTGVNGNISLAPVFIDETAGNYRLAFGSPGIDAGDKTLPTLPNLDLDGFPRVLPSGGNVDMGAYELAAQTTTLLSATEITFGSQPAGSASAPDDLTITNNGTDPLYVTGIAIVGEFLQTNTCQVAGGVLPGASCVVSVRFSPSAGGPHAGQLTIASNSVSANTVDLSGVGTGSLTLSLDSITFADQGIGTISAITALNVTNGGGSPINLTSISTFGDFTGANDCVSPLAPGGACTISVRFAPVSQAFLYGVIVLNVDGVHELVRLSGRGVTSLVTLSPTSLQFGTVTLGSTSAGQTVTLTNSGDAPLTINNIAITGDFSETHDCGSVLAAGESCAFNVLFSPLAVSTRNGEITITDNAVGTPHKVALNGFGSGALLSTTPTSLVFSSQPVGVPGTAKTITIRNTGNVAMTITSIETTGDFSKSGSCGLIGVNGFCNISVTFTPTAPGERSGALTITGSAFGSPYVAPLSGTGIAVDLSFVPPVVSFGDVHTGTTSTITALLKNNRTEPVNISSITASAGFSIVSHCGDALEPLADCQVEVSFSPVSVGLVSGAVTVTDDGAGSPHAAAITGRGVAGLVSLSAITLAFDADVVGTTSPPRAVTVSNQGTAPIVFTGIIVSGDFARTTTCGATLAVSAVCSITVTFSPTEAGSRTGSVSITSDASNNPRTISLAGTGLSSAPTPLITGISPDNAATGASSMTLTVTGAGFSTRSVIRWGGADRPTTYQSSSVLTTALSTADLAEMGSIRVTVFTPTPGGGQSNPASFVVYRVITLSTRDLIFDRAGNRIFASVPSSAPIRGNSLTVIDPGTGNLGNPIPIGSDPGKLAISSDSRLIYVALDGSAQVRSFDTATMNAGVPFGLGTDPVFGKTRYAADIAVSPNHPETVAISMRFGSGIPEHAGVAVFENGVKRSMETAGHTGSNVIEFSESDNILYGYNNESTEFGFRTMAIDSNGVTVSNVKTNLVTGFNTDITFENGRIYTSGGNVTIGQVIDPVGKTVIGTFPVPSSNTLVDIVPDSPLRRAFVLISSASTLKLVCLDLNTLATIGSVSFPISASASGGISSLIRWGKRGLAFRSATEVFTLQIPPSWLGAATGDVPLDLNGDGHTDLLWQHTDGSLVAWLMYGQTPSDAGGLIGAGSGWGVHKIGDFNRDGKADLLWQHTDGASAIWLMNGLSVIGAGGLPGAGTGWTVRHVADFDGDTMSDLLWQHTDGSVAIWLMNGSGVAGAGGVIGPATGWTARTLGDFNGDGKSDILWEHTDGSSAIWLMNGLTPAGVGWLVGPGTGWSVQRVADFNGDGKSDLLWRHTDGSAAIWLMDGVNQTNSGWLIGSGTGWSVSHTGDFNGDGKTDILWQHTDGSVVMWLMNGAASNGMKGLVGPGTGWSVRQIADFNGDGKSDIVWQHSEGSVGIWMMNGLDLAGASGLVGPNTGWSPGP
ncbi:MAG TPA: choice-of-anchor D domain-containing protein [Terriglobia bacterium]|nr:choice-of-anchor D domain-containing protein [Terriglobia bacterium]